MIQFCVLLIFVLVSDKAEGRCNCEFAQKHYEEIGCKPVYNKPEDCCPSHYDCSERIKIDNDPEKCYFDGKLFDNGEKVDSSLTLRNCITACFCNKDKTRNFICAHIDCAEFFGQPPLQPGCYRKYEINKCCSAGVICPPFDKNVECKVGDEVYREGQRFSPSDDSCMSCVCQKGFKGEFVSPFCEPVKCGIGLLSRVDVKSYCAPVYYGNSKCCPIQWECKKETDTREIGTKVDDKTDTTKSCRFGDRALKIGDKFAVKREFAGSPEVNCECRIPPLLTCIQTPNKN